MNLSPSFACCSNTGCFGCCIKVIALFWVLWVLKRDLSPSSICFWYWWESVWVYIALFWVLGYCMDNILPSSGCFEYCLWVVWVMIGICMGSYCLLLLAKETTWRNITLCFGHCTGIYGSLLGTLNNSKASITHFWMSWILHWDISPSSGCFRYCKTPSLGCFAYCMQLCGPLTHT